MGNFIVALRNELWYAALMAVLAFISGGMLVYDFFAKNASGAIIKAMYDLDLGIAYIFLTDFVLGLYFAKHRLRHLKENWFDLLGSIPLSDGLFRAMRILRFVRLVRLLRAANAGLDIQQGIEMIRENRKRKHAKNKRN